LKKLINKVDDIVNESVGGMCAAHSDILKFLPENNVVIRAGAARPKVAVISGSGCGHEPAHVGFVGWGMLDAACVGKIFTAPVPGQIYEASRASDRGRGIFFVVKNYTGDIMNFQMAADMLKGDGIEADRVVVNDGSSRYGMAGVVLVEKMVGAYAEAGATLLEVKDMAERVNASARTFGVTLSGCDAPPNWKPISDLPDDEIEFGAGIHGEPGFERQKLKTSHEVAEYAVVSLSADLPLKAGDDVMAFVNGAGGTPLGELYIVYNDLKKILDSRGVKIARNLVGSYLTSMDTQGMTITLLKLDTQMKLLWDYPVETPALRWGR